MKQILSVLAALCTSFLAASAAYAGGSLKDVGPAPEPARCVGGAFSGFYLGGHLGFGRMSSDQHTIAHPVGEPEIDIPLGFSDDDGGFTIGEHNGYNVQCGRVVFGYESDFNYFGADTRSVVDSECGVDCGTFKSEMNWFGTLRGRLGFVHNDNVLIYGTAGLAYARVDHGFSTGSGPEGELDPPFSQSNKKTEFGWTAGGGIEFMRDKAWSLRADALYVDLGSESQNYNLDCSEECSNRTRWDDEFWVARIGLTYHFGQREAEPIVPLK